VVPFFAGIEAFALILAAAALLYLPIGGVDLARFGALLAIAIVQAELSRTIERVRRTIAEAPHVNMTSVWTFAGALLLPAGLAAVLAVLVYAHLWIRVWRPMPSRATYRVVYCAAAIVLSCLAATAVLGVGGIRAALPTGTTGSLLVIQAALVFTVVNAVVIAVSVYLHTGERSFRALIGSGEDNALEFATLVLGGLTAVGLIYEPLLVVFILLPVLMLHRSVLVQQLEIAATTDIKTGVLNAGAWHELSERALSSAARERRPFGLLMLDLDHFKDVNDSYGHLAGDVVLKAVATAIKEQVRDYDSVGRFGGEEFVVLLPGISEGDVLAVAERIREAVLSLEIDVVTAEEVTAVRGLSVSIGVAVCPAAGTILERLLHAADAALYEAKNTGRNKVVSIARAA
jgi:diguanylate cyclase (GGDEF)-like protein